MSSPVIQTSSSRSDSSSVPLINIDELCKRDAYITNINQFLYEQDYRKALVYWLSEHEKPELLFKPADIHSAINRTIAEIDEYINEQLNRIIQHASFKRLESAWRGLWYLAVQADNTTSIKLKVLDISWSEVVKDISRALDFDQSILFNKVYSEEYGTPGGEPYGVLIGDYEISHRPSRRHPHDDLGTLDGLSQIAAAAFCPFIAGTSPELFGLDDFTELGRPLNFSEIFSHKDYIKWRAIRKNPDSRFVGLTVPRTLMRLPYRKSPGSYKGVYFHEKPSSAGNSHYLWGNACYAFAGVLIREYDNVGWFGHIRGVPRSHLGGGLLTNLPVDCFDTDHEGVAHKPVTDVIITDTCEKELSDNGFIPLCQCQDTPFAAFYNNQSIQQPLTTESRDTNINARLSAMLQHVLCASRIAHYIKIMIRDKVGSFITAEKCEEYLREWLFKYTTGREDLDWEEQARYPLREAAVNVREHPSKPGQYLCVIHLRPHYQLDQMISELELVTELTQAGG